jgi:hypothetical protein
MLLCLSKFRGQDSGWIPVSTLEWLHRNHRLCLPPPGSRVWMRGLHTSDVPAFAQVASLSDAEKKPVAHCGTFSVGNLVFQVFCCEQAAAVLSPVSEAWLQPKHPFASALVQIAPAIATVRWPPEAVFTVDTMRPLAGRLQ